MRPSKKSTVTLWTWSEMTKPRLHARRQGMVKSCLSQQPKSISELYHPPPSDTQPNGEQRLTRQRMLKVKGPRAAQTLSDTKLEKRDTAISDNPQKETSEVEHRFWNETTQYADSPTLLANTGKSTKTSLNAGHPSIAAATIIGIIVFGAICFLLFWYIRRERRRRRRLQIQSPSQDLFNPSSLSLGPETSKTLDDFLMRDVPPERASLMFSRTRPPSVTYIVGEANRRSNRNSYDESSSLTKLDTLDTLARVSTDATRPSFIISELSSSSQSRSPQNTSAQHTSTTSPRASMASAGPASPRSSQLWATTTTATTTSDTTERSSLLPQESGTSRTSQSTHGSNVLLSPASSLMQPRSSNASRASASRASSRYSAGSVVRSSPRGIYDPRGQRTNHGRSRSSQSVSPIAESTSSGPLPSISSTPSPLFRFSEA